MAQPGHEESISTLTTTKVQDLRACLRVAFKECHKLLEWRTTYIPRFLVLFFVVCHSSALLRIAVGQLTGPWISGGGRRELARDDRSPLHPLDGRREAPDRRWMIHPQPRWRGASASVPSSDYTANMKYITLFHADFKNSQYPLDRVTHILHTS
jgi:hypothetical protein